MAPQSQSQSQSQYHVFSLPRELLVNLTLRNLISQERHASLPPLEPQTVTSTNAARSCNVCPGASFVDVDNQRAHFRTDWHRYNVKARLSSGKPVAEVDFAALVESLEDSLSGSESSSDEDATSDSDTVHTLLTNSREPASRSTSPSRQTSAPQTALTWFHSPPSTQIGVYRSLFISSTLSDQYIEELKAMQNGGQKGRRWAMFMVAGGHFAGVVVRVSKGEEQLDVTTKSKSVQKKVIPDMEILRHKTFHRYTTRRKQGGSQSLNDNAKGNAKSAGALLRRYGEQALREEIRNLISEWADDIADCERIWLRASGANKRIFWDYDEAVIMKGDKRLRSFPFPTRRPTQSELSRCLMELTRVKMTHFTLDELKAQDEAYLASLPKPKPDRSAVLPEIKAPENLIPKFTKEELLLRDKWFRLIEMIKKGRLDAAKGFWEREGNSLGGVDVLIPEWTDEKVGTLLQLAALSGQKEISEWLLNDLRADPTLPVPLMKLTDDSKYLSDHDSPNVPLRRAYDLAADRATRDVFRRCADIHPDLWDWFGAAHVPSGLSKEMEEERENKVKIRRKGLKDKIREREAREKEKEIERENEEREEKEKKEREARLIQEQINANANGPRKLGGVNAKNTIESVAGLTPEMRARIERERRARAAEARLKAMNGG